MSEESKTPASDELEPMLLEAGQRKILDGNVTHIAAACYEQLKRIADALQARAEGAAIDAFLEGFTAGDEKESLAAALNKWHEERYGK